MVIYVSLFDFVIFQGSNILYHGFLMPADISLNKHDIFTYSYTG